MIKDQTVLPILAASWREDFRQWVIEDNFVAGRPDWDKVGDVRLGRASLGEEMKLRMLNGAAIRFSPITAASPDMKVYLIRGCAGRRRVFKTAVHHLMTEEQAKSPRPNGIHQYAQLLIERFSNPNIKHKDRTDW